MVRRQGRHPGHRPLGGVRHDLLRLDTDPGEHLRLARRVAEGAGAIRYSLHQPGRHSYAAVYDLVLICFAKGPFNPDGGDSPFYMLSHCDYCFDIYCLGPSRPELGLSLAALVVAASLSRPGNNKPLLSPRTPIFSFLRSAWECRPDPPRPQRESWDLNPLFLTHYKPASCS